MQKIFSICIAVVIFLFSFISHVLGFNSDTYPNLSLYGKLDSLPLDMFYETVFEDDNIVIVTIEGETFYVRKE